MFQLAVIGAGQLGSRHLQGLAKTNFSAEIWVMDPSADSLKTAESRYNEVKSDNKKVFFVQSIAEIKAKKIDLVIVATNSFHRLNAIESLAAHCEIKYMVLEKVLFPSFEEYDISGKIIREKNIKTWVNCCMRMNELYSEIKNELKGKFSFTAVGNSWGLGCNTIHYLDLFAFFSGTQDIHLTQLITETFPAKRNGYIEFEGSMKGVDAKGNHFLVTSVENTPVESIITIQGTDRTYIIDPLTNNGNAWIKTPETKGQWKSPEFRIKFQSELSTELGELILNTGECPLPSFEESSELHKIFLTPIFQYLQENSSEKITKCPIT
ncbi:MAG: Gfo/Idh/MocA family oxidoreductase [Bacteroidetes bacterium]|nr:Gfo/Idh/MocA family oxidoreductase [Bacteroidota bacterium]